LQFNHYLEPIPAVPYNAPLQIYTQSGGDVRVEVNPFFQGSPPQPQVQEMPAQPYYDAPRRVPQHFESSFSPPGLESLI
jgi:hypothetical protein